MKARAQGRDAPRACMRASCGAVRRESSAVRPQWAKMWRRLKHRCRKYSRPAPSLPSRIERKPLFCVRPSLKRGCPVILSADAHHPRQSEFPAQIEKLLNSGKAAQALELADLGIRKNERSPQLRFMRAVALENLTRSEEAVRELKQLIIDYPEIPEPYNNLAVIEAGLGNLEEAVAHLKQALRINPDFALARKNLGDVYLALAREAYEQAVVKLPNNHVLERRLNTLKSLETAR